MCADGVVYLRDVCLTLAAFLAVAPATASLIIGDGGSNLAALAPLHDELLFALESSAQRQNPPASGVGPAAPLAIPITSWSVTCSMAKVVLKGCTVLSELHTATISGDETDVILVEA